MDSKKGKEGKSTDYNARLMRFYALLSGYTKGSKTFGGKIDKARKEGKFLLVDDVRVNDKLFPKATERSLEAYKQISHFTALKALKNPNGTLHGFSNKDLIFSRTYRFGGDKDMVMNRLADYLAWLGGDQSYIDSILNNKDEFLSIESSLEDEKVVRGTRPSGIDVNDRLTLEDMMIFSSLLSSKRMTLASLTDITPKEGEEGYKKHGVYKEGLAAHFVALSTKAKTVKSPGSPSSRRGVPISDTAKAKASVTRLATGLMNAAPLTEKYVFPIKKTKKLDPVKGTKIANLTDLQIFQDQKGSVYGVKYNLAPSAPRPENAIPLNWPTNNPRHIYVTDRSKVEPVTRMLNMLFPDQNDLKKVGVPQSGADLGQGNLLRSPSREGKITSISAASPRPQYPVAANVPPSAGQGGAPYVGQEGGMQIIPGQGRRQRR